jgi:DNA helicase HerA-like ATPase
MYLRLIYAEAIKKSPLETVVIIDEAHNILPKTEVNFIAKMLAEVRKMRLGLVISTQSPSSINPEYLKNLNTKIVHRVVNGADKRVLVESLGGPGKLSSLLSSLRVGDAIISLPDSPKPQLVKITSICGGQG